MLVFAADAAGNGNGSVTCPPGCMITASSPSVLFTAATLMFGVIIGIHISETYFMTSDSTVVPRNSVAVSSETMSELRQCGSATFHRRGGKKMVEMQGKVIRVYVGSRKEPVDFADVVVNVVTATSDGRRVRDNYFTVTLV